MTDYPDDVDTLLGKRHDNGGDFWASEDGRVYVGNPFSTIGTLGMLHELRVGMDHEAVAGGLDLILAACRDDGRIRVAPTAPMYPCYTAEAARMLCRFGLSDSECVGRVVERFLDGAHDTGGWRCSFSKFGKGPETELANPGATLYVLDVLRFFPALRAGSGTVDGAVESLLSHWETREPIGPCHWGIGEQFMQVEYPFLRYNLFYFAYVLSFYERAAGDPRFDAALAALEARLAADGRIVVETPHRRLARLRFCERGRPSDAATARWNELCGNLGR